MKRQKRGYSAERVTFPLIAGSFEICTIILFGFFGRYASDVVPATSDSEPPHATSPNAYAMFQDVHVMVFVGFGFLMAFLKRYSYSAVGMNFVVAAFCIQWAMVIRGLFNLDESSHFYINLQSMLFADLTTATVLISFGAVLGKTSPTQLMVMALIEIVCAQANEFVGLEKLRVTDCGASIFVHTFGAYFGLAVARVLYRDDIHQVSGEGSVYHSDVFAMIGTIFLWLFWPSFNASTLVGVEQNRAIINTYLSLATSCVTSFIVSFLVCGNFNPVHIQNATLAGGVAIGTVADLLVRPFGALIIGVVAGTMSVLGYKFVTPWLSKTLKIHDTCGVNNLHGMPGILAGFIGAMMASGASLDQYGLALFDKFSARRPIDYYSVGYNRTLQQLGPLSGPKLDAMLDSSGFGDERSGPVQAGYQFSAIFVTIGFAVVTGGLTGFVLRLPIFDIVEKKRIFEDDYWWEMAEFDHFDEPKEEQTSEDNSNEYSELAKEDTEVPLTIAV